LTHEWTWPDVAAELAASRSYWLATSRPDGAPHAVPVWGVVVAGDLHLYSERRTAKARNVAADPRVVVHLESAERVLIVRGTLVDLGAPAEAPEVVSALDAKYSAAEDRGYLPSADDSFDVVWRLAPIEAMSWDLEDYEASHRRWRSAAIGS
jgi:nitroimidazol reductase NimA-like FMN-containing flavoprotein (pyridoxamine 5'-phosphate oxidase superfamily)